MAYIACKTTLIMQEKSESGGKHNRHPIGSTILSNSYYKSKKDKNIVLSKNCLNPDNPLFIFIRSKAAGGEGWCGPENRHVLMPTDQRVNNVEILEATGQHKRNTHKQSLMRQ